jgi:hypothetical protein
MSIKPSLSLALRETSDFYARAAETARQRKVSSFRWRPSGMRSSGVKCGRVDLTAVDSRLSCTSNRKHYDVCLTNRFQLMKSSDDQLSYFDFQDRKDVQPSRDHRTKRGSDRNPCGRSDVPRRPRTQVFGSATVIT